MRSFVGAGLLAFFLFAGGSAGAQQAAERPTYKALIDQGYEIRATMFLPAEAGSRIANSPQQDTVSVTLQKGTSTATCWMSFASWNSHAIATVACNTLK